MKGGSDKMLWHFVTAPLCIICAVAMRRGLWAVRFNRCRLRRQSCCIRRRWRLVGKAYERAERAMIKMCAQRTAKAHSPLPTAHCPLPIAHCPLPIAFAR